MKSQKTSSPDLSKSISKVINKIISECNEMDDLIFSRFIWYLCILVILGFLFFITLFTIKNLEIAILPLLAFVGMAYLTVSFFSMYRKDEFAILYAVCESKDAYTQNLIEKYHAITDKKRRKYEYRLLVSAPNGEDSYIYLILTEYNRMREGASYKILFRKTDDGEYSEKNMICFKQLQQQVRSFPATKE